MDKHTPTPWDWLIHDHSMASLGVMPDPGLGNPLVLTVSPCQGCMDRAEPREWKWGRCHTPSEADADFILVAVNNHDALVKALKVARARIAVLGPFTATKHFEANQKIFLPKIDAVLAQATGLMPDRTERNATSTGEVNQEAEPIHMEANP